MNNSNPPESGHHASSNRHHHHHSSSHGHSSSASGSQKKHHSKTKIKSLAVLGLLAISVIVQLFPYGLIPRLMNGKPISGLAFDQIFTYFNMDRYGQTNFGPLILTISCVLLLVISIVQLIRPAAVIKRLIPIMAAISVAVVLLPACFEVSTLSMTGILVILILAFVWWLSSKNPFKKRR